jgi:hypothetical protein
VSVTGKYCVEKDTWPPAEPKTDVGDPQSDLSEGRRSDPAAFFFSPMLQRG